MTLQQDETIIINPYTVSYALQNFIKQHSPVRKLLLNDKLAPGECAVYDVDENAIVIYLSDKLYEDQGIEACQFATEVILKPEDPDKHPQFFLPTFNFAIKEFTIFKNEKERSQRYERTEEFTEIIYEKAKEIVRYETDVLIELLNKLPDDRIITAHFDATTAASNNAHRLIENEGGIVYYALTTQTTIDKAIKASSQFSKVYDGQNIFTAEVIITSHPKLENKIYFLAQPDYVGAICERQGITSLEIPKGEEIRMVIFYEPGFFIANHQSVSCLNLLDPEPTY